MRSNLQNISTKRGLQTLSNKRSPSPACQHTCNNRRCNWKLMQGKSTHSLRGTLIPLRWGQPHLPSIQRPLQHHHKVSLRSSSNNLCSHLQTSLLTATSRLLTLWIVTVWTWALQLPKKMLNLWLEEARWSSKWPRFSVPSSNNNN